ncbi:MAG: extracellular solute-binding protein [Candidatus Pacebacteria bacterium]|nr:extracellular solute-binding protein [Candidatus Paceibacterota bacterium]
MSKKFLILILFISLIISGSGYFLFKSYPNFKVPQVENDRIVEVELEFWGLWDNSDDWKKIIEKFEKKTYKFDGQKVRVAINYTKKDFASYREDIEKAKEKNNNPNIFYINNNWFSDYKKDLEPLSGNSAYTEEYDFLSYDDVLDIFPAKTMIDFVDDNLLYSIPLYTDSLALYYNKDLFQKAGIENPPKSWTELKNDAVKLTVFGKKDSITQSGVAFGTGKNVNRSSDILSLLIMQGGGKVIDGNGEVDINKEIEINTVEGLEKRNPGKRAISFYSEFSDPRKEIYSWNSDQQNSIQSFADRKSAMMFGYSYQIQNLLSLKPDLDYAVAPMPQLENSTVINFSNIFSPVVSKDNNCKVDVAELSDKIDCSKIAWSFLSFATNKENSEIYLDLTNKAAARKDLIQKQIQDDSHIGVFASQAESVVSYNKFSDEIDDILVNMLDEINLDREKIDEKIDEVVEKIEALR